MPMNRELYPADWNRIAHSVKESAGWHCEECNRPCRKTGEKLELSAEAALAKLIG